MNAKQSTIKERCSLTGVGLHTGQEVTLTFCPAGEGEGIKFKRVDLPSQPIVEADVDNVIDLSRGTTIAKGDAKVGTVEHVMAALAGLEIDNVLVEIDGGETPIMDGSAMPFVEALQTSGLREQAADREYFEIPHNVYYSEPERGVEMVAMPLNGYRITVMVDYNSTVLGSQHASITELAEFVNEVATSRTFCFLHELEALVKANLIKGGDLNNAIVIVDRKVEEPELQKLAELFQKEKIEVQAEGILNNVQLRYQNEPARHKLLDLIGDLALIGSPIKAQIMAARPGHAANIEFAKKIKRLMQKRKREAAVPKYNPDVVPVYDSKQIKQILPHDHPFLFVDKVTEISAKHAVGIKSVTMTEDFFRGHFPDDPIMPGVLQVEALAQLGGIMFLSNVDKPEEYMTLFMKIENAKFKDKVVPGDTMVMRVELMAPLRRGIGAVKGQIFIGSKLVMEAELLAQILKKR